MVKQGRDHPRRRHDGAPPVEHRFNAGCASLSQFKAVSVVGHRGHGTVDRPVRSHEQRRDVERCARYQRSVVFFPDVCRLRGIRRRCGQRCCQGSGSSMRRRDVTSASVARSWRLWASQSGTPDRPVDQLVADVVPMSELHGAQRARADVLTDPRRWPSHGDDRRRPGAAPHPAGQSRR